MKIKVSIPKRKKRPQPLSFRLSKEAVVKLKKLSKTTNKTMTDIIEEIIDQAYIDTL